MVDWPKHKCGMYITHNQHLDYYMTAEQRIAEINEQSDGDGDDFISDEERNKAIAANEIWEIQWYPETPVGFCRVLASTFEAAMKAACADD